MLNPERINEFKNILSSARSVLIVLPGHPHVDHLSAGLGLYLSLAKNHQVQIITPSALTVSHNRLIAVDQIKQGLTGSKQLIFSLPNPTEHIERVYTEVDQETKEFKIVVEAVQNSPGFDSKSVRIYGESDKVDLIIFVGARHPDDVSEITDQLTSLLDQARIMKIDTMSHSQHLNGLELINEQASALSEIVYELLKKSQSYLDQDIATDILAGIEYRTDNLTHFNITADTFETVAACLRLGGVRGYSQIPPTEIQNLEPADQPAAPVSDQQPIPITAPPAPEPPSQVSIPTSPPSSQNVKPAAPSNKIPAWLTPKIFSGQKQN